MTTTGKAGLLIGAAVGSGIAAQAAERGGADLLLAVNAGRMRNMGAPSIASMLPCHDAAQMTRDFAAREILPRAGIPVLLGVNCWQETDDLAAQAADVGELGFSGAVNFPNATLMPRGMQRLLDTAGRGYQREIALMVRVQALGLTALYYCGTKVHARAAAEAGIGMILLNFGWNAGGASGHAQRASLEEVGLIARDYSSLIRRINPRAKILLEGGPVVSADDLGHVANMAELDGYVGGSTLDRLPFEESIVNRIAGYRHAADLTRTVSRRQEQILRKFARHGFVGQSPALIDLIERLEGLAETTHPLAVSFETGTPLQPVFSALTQGNVDLFQLDAEGEPALQLARRLFGRDRNDGQEHGLLTAPNAPVLALHGIDAAPPSLQRRLTRTLQSGILVTAQRRHRIRLTARCLFMFQIATNDAPLPARLHPELAALLSGWTVTLKPLRDRIADLPRIIEARAANSGIEKLPDLSPAALQRLRSHPWPGNELELDQLIGRLVQAQTTDALGGEDISALLQSGGSDTDTAVRSQDLERQHIVDALWRNDFHRGRTAAALHMSRKTLYNKMRAFGLMG